MIAAAQMAALVDQVLARFADELLEADALQLTHLAQRAEARYQSDLGARMRALVDAERGHRAAQIVSRGGIRPMSVHLCLACQTGECDRDKPQPVDPAAARQAAWDAAWELIRAGDTAREADLAGRATAIDQRRINEAERAFVVARQIARAS